MNTDGRRFIVNASLSGATTLWPLLFGCDREVTGLKLAGPPIGFEPDKE
jgi:hypothetical protein